MALFLSKNDVRKILREVLEEELGAINTNLARILMNQTELKAALDAAVSKVTKIEMEQTARFNKQSMLIEEQTAEIKRLTDLLNAGGEVTPEVAACVAALQANLQAFDDTIPDAPAPENPA